MDDHVPLRSNFALTAAYTRMVQGFGGHPKFSKSIPGSALDVRTPPDDVHRLLANEPNVPEKSATYQLMCQMPTYSGSELLDLDAYCREGGRKWQAEVRAFADYVVDLIRLWPH
jgi:hypothetical protein